MTPEKRKEQQQTAINAKANSSIHTTFSLSVILEGYALDLGVTEIYENAVLLREFLGKSPYANNIGDASDALSNIFLEIADKKTLTPIICELIWRESRKFTELYRQYDPRFIFGQEAVVKRLFHISRQYEINEKGYRQISKLINQLKKL